MPNAFAISMTRPHDALGIPKPLARRLPTGLVAWNIAISALTLGCALCYVVQVNMASTKSYELRKVSQHVEGLKTDMMIMQDKMVKLSSMQALNDRATELGFAPVDRLEFVNPASKSYALAR